MPMYSYKAMTSTGVIVRNRVEATNKLSLVRRLKQNDLMPIAIVQTAYNNKRNKKQKKNVKDLEDIMSNVNTTTIKTRKTSTIMEKINLYLSKQEKVKPRDIVIFTQNFYLLKKANFNNIHALRTIIDSTENLTFKGVLEDILAGVEAGDNMYTTMEYYSDIFPFIYINMIKVGELSGSLTNSLEQAVGYLESSEAMTRKLRQILVPNLVTFGALIVMLIVGTIVAIPAIQNVYDSFGSTEQLPAVTIWFQGVVNWLVASWYIPGVIVFYVHTPKGKYNFDYFKYRMPIFGPLIFAIDFSRLMKAMLLNLQNGMRIQEAIEVSKNIAKNYVMLSLIETALNNILVGDSWIEPFERSGLTSSMQTEMLKIGMQTDLTEMMEKLVEYMEIDIDVILNRVMKALPNLVYSIVGAVLVIFVLVVLDPCIQVNMGGWLFEAAGV